MEIRKILIVGIPACSGKGNFERQLGNVAILTPTITMLKDSFPKAEVSTNFQLSEEFCRRNGISSIKDPAVWSFAPRYLLKSALNLLRCIMWRSFRKIGLNVETLISERKLREFAAANVILDISGDTYSDNFNYIRVIKHSMDILAARLLGKPIVLFAQSCGPFKGWPIRSLARLALNRATLITTRESLTKDYLQDIGISKPSIFATACPAFLFEATSKERVEQIFKQEGISLDNEPLIGLTFCSFNISINPMRIIIQNKWLNTMKYFLPKLFYNLVEKRMKSVKFLDTHVAADLTPFVQAIDYLVEKLHATVLLIPHVYESKSSRYHILSDKGLAEKLYELTKSDNTDKIKMLRGKYNAEDVKGIIGECDIFISGRMHAAIAALSQNVPTVGLPYGLKFYGIFGMLGQESHVCSSNNADDIISIVNEVWKNKEKISKELASKVPEAKKLALLNTELVKDILNISQ